MAKTTKEIKAWLTSLEAERHDQSYKRPKETALTEYTKIVYRDKVVDHKFRDNIMFHFGRFTEGARDKDAINAERIAKNLIGGKNGRPAK